MNALHKMQGGRRKRTPSNPHQGRKEMPLMRPWRLLLKHVTSRRSEVFFYTSKKCQETAEDLQRHHQRHSCKKRSAREIRQVRDHEDGGLGDHGGGLLQDAP